MHLLYCWRCGTDVPVMNEQESAQLEEAHRTAITGIMDYRARRNVPLAEVPLEEFHRPVQLTYQRLSRAAGFDAPIVPFEHLLDHSATRFGPPCEKCGKPLRTPKAKLCAECGAPRRPA